MAACRDRAAAPGVKLEAVASRAESGRRWGAGGSALCSGVLEIRVLLQVLPSTRRRARHGGGPGGSQGASRGRNASARDVISKIYLSIQGAWQHLRAGPGPELGSVWVGGKPPTLLEDFRGGTPSRPVRLVVCAGGSRKYPRPHSCGVQISPPPASGPPANPRTWRR